MSGGIGLLRVVKTIGLVLAMGVSMNACATGTVGLGGDSWKEQALQYDGSVIIVKRFQSYGGRGEIGQGAPIRDYRLIFTLPGAGQPIEWESDYSEDVGRANLHPLALHVLNGTPYVITEPNLCLAYNKWGRPNPPYVIFKHDGGQWQRIPVGQLPPEFKDMNLVNDTKDEARHLVQAGQVSAEEVKRLNREITQPEYKTILREALPKERINQMCMEMVPYKGSWVMPNDPIARKFIDQQNR
jgi:hypothetical protein